MSLDPLDTAMAFDTFDSVAFNARYGPPMTAPVNPYASFHTQPRERFAVPISTWVLLAALILALTL
jgi:hypothetical protein